VHSYEQMRATVEFGGKSLSQYSQFGRSCSAIATSIAIAVTIAEKAKVKLCEFSAEADFCPQYARN
jgi:hypothetical protein